MDVEQEWLDLSASQHTGSFQTSLKRKLDPILSSASTLSDQKFIGENIPHSTACKTKKQKLNQPQSTTGKIKIYVLKKDN